MWHGCLEMRKILHRCESVTDIMLICARLNMPVFAPKSPSQACDCDYTMQFICSPSISSSCRSAFNMMQMQTCLESFPAGLPPYPGPQPDEANIGPHQCNHEAAGQIVGICCTYVAKVADTQVGCGKVGDERHGTHTRLWDRDPLSKHDTVGRPAEH